VRSYMLIIFHHVVILYINLYFGEHSSTTYELYPSGYDL
jgi:hypothetical protein